jgi:uncharacterized protein (TIGR03437 family)
MLVPSAASPDFTAYAAFEVQGPACPTSAPAGSQCPTSKLVYMYTNYTAPGVFSLAENGIGPAAAEQGAGYTVIGANNPAAPGGIPMLFLTGMGSVTPPLADGVPSSSTGQPWNLLNIYNESALDVYFDGSASPNIPFAGVVPGYAAGLYQIDAQIPCSVSSGDDYVDIQTPDAEAEQVTVNVAGACPAGVIVVGDPTAKRKSSGRGRRAVAVRRGSAAPQQVGPVSR